MKRDWSKADRKRKREKDSECRNVRQVYGVSSWQIEHIRQFTAKPNISNKIVSCHWLKTRLLLFLNNNKKNKNCISVVYAEPTRFLSRSWIQGLKSFFYLILLCIISINAFHLDRIIESKGLWVIRGLLQIPCINVVSLFFFLDVFVIDTEATAEKHFRDDFVNKIDGRKSNWKRWHAIALHMLSSWKMWKKLRRRSK